MNLFFNATNDIEVRTREWRPDNRNIWWYNTSWGTESIYGQHGPCYLKGKGFRFSLLKKIYFPNPREGWCQEHCFLLLFEFVFLSLYISVRQSLSACFFLLSKQYLQCSNSRNKSSSTGASTSNIIAKIRKVLRVAIVPSWYYQPIIVPMLAF